jgi:hypothetical protein
MGSLNMVRFLGLEVKTVGMSLAANPFGSHQYLRNKPQEFRGFFERLTAPKAV